jgi:4,5-dihydroxyphthalate decarboxylase
VGSLTESENPVRLTIACGDYDRTHALIDGSVKPSGLELQWLTIPHHEMWTGTLNEGAFDVSELSFAWYVIARTLHKPLIAIPVFPARAFRHSYIFINNQSGIREPRDLIGKKVGLGEFQQTAAVAARAFLQHDYGIDPRTIRWFTWGRQSMPVKLPGSYEIQAITSRKSPDRLLIDGDVDALICSSLFPSFAQGAPNVRRLFENYKEIEIAYFRKTRIFPIMHTIVLREELWKQHPWIATSLYQAFQEAKSRAYQRLDDLSPYKISLVWFREPVREQKEIFGEDPWCDGLEPNRKTIDALVEYLYEQELIDTRPSVEELFAPNLSA